MLEIICLSPFVIIGLGLLYFGVKYKTHQSFVNSEFRWVGLYADGEHYVQKDGDKYELKVITEKFNVGDVVEMGGRLFQVSIVSHLSSTFDQVYLDPFTGNREVVDVRFVDARIAEKEELYVNLR